LRNSGRNKPGIIIGMRSISAKITAGIVIAGLLSVFLGGQKLKESELAPQYRDWLKLVGYIIQSEEKNVFLLLANDRERNIFIETFWKQRDPTPGTPQNEYKEEHIKRFDYANEHFRRDSPREGWMTDRGRFYIILGPPVSIERFDNQKGLYPAEVWYYYGEREKGLPAYFALVFFKRGGAGEYRLYDPVSDGPSSLMIEGREVDPLAYQRVYEKLYDLAPSLALVSLSMVPGEIPFNYQPSPRNNIIIADIMESVKEDVNPAYATHFLNYRGIVSTDYLTNYVESDAESAVIPDPVIGLNFVHFLIVPRTISVDYYEPKNQYYCHFTLNVSLRQDEGMVFQYSKEFPFYFTAEELENIKASGMAIEDSFPLAEGRFQLTVLLTNSTGKEFTIYEKEINIQEDAGKTRIVGPFLGYKFETYGRDVHIPFKILENKLAMDPKKTYSLKDTLSLLCLVENMSQELWESGKVEIQIQGLRDTGPVEKNLTVKLSHYPFNKIMSLPYSLPAQELSPDYYELRVRLLDGDGTAIDSESGQFVLTSAEAVAHPTAYAKGIPLAHSYAYFDMVASQYRKTRQPDKAEACYKRALEMKPGYGRGLLDYAQFLFEGRRFAESLDLVEQIRDEEELKFSYYLVKGRALLGLERYFEALENLEEANKIYNSDTTLLNSLGVCYYKTNQKQKALEALKASLRLNPEQEDIKKLVRELEGS
jgi:GWxTD domain-containing protein